MKSKEFLEMMKQELINNDDSNLNSVYQLFETVLRNKDFEIKPDKTLHGFYEHMRSYAKENQKNNSFCINPLLAEELLYQYLEIDKKEIKSISIDDLF